jgi:hypothetical protein
MDMMVQSLYCNAEQAKKRENVPVKLVLVAEGCPVHGATGRSPQGLRKLEGFL